MIESINQNLIVFAKRPILGKVKTRLSVTTGNEEALAIYIQLLEYTKKVSNHNDWNTYWYWDDSSGIDEFLPSEFNLRTQSHGDLGNRMSSAFQDVFSAKKTMKSYKTKICIIGSDCPQLTPEHIQIAFSSLDTYDFVIGPSRDGGYYLLGMQEFSGEVFQDINWSTDSVLEQTQASIDSIGKTYTLMDTLIDIDTAKDWEEFSKLTK